LYFDEFESICKSWTEMREQQEHAEWERARTLAAIIIQPHLKKKVTPRQLLPLPWDRKNTGLPSAPDAPILTADERRRRFEEVARRLGDEII
jgi:hypothetical protein